MRARIQAAGWTWRSTAVAAGLVTVIGATGIRAIAQARGGSTPAAPAAQTTRPAGATAQKIDEDYTKRILDNTPDKRILTELSITCRCRPTESAVAAQVLRLRPRRERRSRTTRTSCGI